MLATMRCEDGIIWLRMSDEVTKISMLRDEVLALSAIVFSLVHIFTIGWN
jgi:hypothetical protein